MSFDDTNLTDAPQSDEDQSVAAPAESADSNTQSGGEGRGARRGGGDRRGQGRNGDRRSGGRGERRGDFREAPKEFMEELLRVDRVTRVTAGGRQLRFRAAVVIGDKKGRIGLGIGKSSEVAAAVEKAVRDAKKHLITFPMKDGTIPYGVEAKFKASRIVINPAVAGTGIIAGGSVRKLLSVSGLQDVLAKLHGAKKNPIANAQVMIRALAKLGSNPRVGV